MLAYLAVTIVLAIPSRAEVLVTSMNPYRLYDCVIPGTGVGQPNQAPLKDGTPAAVVQCVLLSNANGWKFQPGETMVKWQPTDLCLDAGKDMAEGAVVKLRTCSPGLPQQTWWYTEDHCFALKGRSKCLTAPHDPDFSKGKEKYDLTLTECRQGDATQNFDSLIVRGRRSSVKT